MKWPRYRYAFPNLLTVAVLAVLAGWAAFCGVMSLNWVYFPERKQDLIQLFSDRHWIFFPPLFGSSPLAYLLAVFLVVMGCISAALFLRQKTVIEKHTQSQSR